MSNSTFCVAKHFFAPCIEYRLADGATVARVVDRVALGALFDAVPWRTFRWYTGQRHYSGVYWAATECAHVIYESRLELAELLLADFDPGVSRQSAALPADRTGE